MGFRFYLFEGYKTGYKSEVIFSVRSDVICELKKKVSSDFIAWKFDSDLLITSDQRAHKSLFFKVFSISFSVLPVDKKRFIYSSAEIL